MITFKQFLVEGGAATSDLKTERANKADIEAALDFVSKHTGIGRKKLEGNLLGSTGHTLAGKKKDSGDVDIALEDGMFDRDAIVEKMAQATGMDKVNPTGGATYSFAVPVGGGKKVQVDLMFVASEKWARFGYHSALESEHRGVVRNFLLVNLMKQLYEKGKDLSIIDPKHDVEAVRVRRGFKMDGGLERLFRVAPLRKDGKGRVALRKGTPEEVDAILKQLGSKETFSRDADAILDPDKAAEFMFGKGVKATDLLSAEQVIKQIFKRPDHAEIFKGAIEDIERADQPVPAEIKQFK
jgi:hypothetical protein